MCWSMILDLTAYGHKIQNQTPAHIFTMQFKSPNYHIYVFTDLKTISIAMLLSLTRNSLVVLLVFTPNVLTSVVFAPNICLTCLSTRLNNAEMLQQ